MGEGGGAAGKHGRAASPVLGLKMSCLCRPYKTHQRVRGQRVAPGIPLPGFTQGQPHPSGTRGHRPLISPLWGGDRELQKHPLLPILTSSTPVPHPGKRGN